MSNFKNYKELPIEKLVPAHWNYKKDPSEEKALMEKLKANILSNGQVENIIVRRLTDNTYEVVNGNHRFHAIKELNIKTKTKNKALFILQNKFELN
jgi:ParB-like chromosome segregation protein Spo0J